MAPRGGGLGIVLGGLLACSLPGPAHGQEAPPLERPAASTGATLGGTARVAFLARAGALDVLRAALNFDPPPTSASSSFLPYDVSLNLDIAWTPEFRSVLELGHEPFVRGANEPLGDDGHAPIIRRLYAEWRPGDWTLRAGAFDYAWRLRPHDEPFFLDAGHADSAWSGAVHPVGGGAFVVPAADRDVSHPAGLAALWRASDFLHVEAVGLVLRERGPAGDDETVTGLLANFPLSERSAGFLALAHFAGRDPGDGVVSLGLGWNGYFGGAREWEGFAEAWIQRGSIGDGVRQRALGGQAGGRWFGGSTWVELSLSHRGGDADPADGTCEAFLSYENQARFLLVEDPEAGLDWDTNLRSLRAAAGWRPAPGTELRIDLGSFRLVEDLFDASGTDRGASRVLGTELDLSASRALSKQVEFRLRAGWLAGSDVLDDLAGERGAWAATAGLRVSW